MKEKPSNSHEWSFLEEKIHKIDIEIESAEHAISHAMAKIEQEDLIQSIVELKQKRKKLLDKSHNY